MKHDRGFGACDNCARLAELVSVQIAWGCWQVWCRECAEEATECDVCEALSKDVDEITFGDGSSIRVCGTECGKEGARAYREDRQTRDFLRGVR